MAQFTYEPEWRSRNVLERLGHAYGNGYFVDRFVISFLGRQYPIRAHKNFLAHVSQVFQEHFYGAKKDSHTLSGIHPLGLSYVLRLLYKLPSTLGYGDISVILFAYHAARTLCIPHIERQIKEEIAGLTIGDSILTVEEFWKFLELSRVLRLEDVTEALLKFAAIHMNKIIHESSLEIASSGTVKQVIELDKLNAPEIDVLANVVRWYNANSSEPFAKDFLKDLLSCVRFRNISLKDFVAFMKGHWGIMNGQDVMMISMHLDRPMVYPLPSWCSLKFRLPISLTVLSHFKEQQDKSLFDNVLEAGPVTEDPIRLSDMFILGKFTDVCFVVGPLKRQIRAHRNILALGSPVFERMFFGSLADSRHEIEITTECTDGFEAMIRFYYDDSHPDDLFSNPDLSSMTFDVALKYGSEKLRTLCSSYIEPESLKLKTFWKHLEYRLQLGSEGENESILQQFPRFAESNAGDIFKHFTFLTAAREAVIFVLQLHSLNTKEIDILECVSQWIEHHFLTSFQDVKYELLGHIRFSDISSNEIMDFLKRHPDIFTSDESLQILFYVSGKSRDVPEWCCRGPSRRLRQVSQAKNAGAERGKYASADTFNTALKQPKLSPFKLRLTPPNR